MFDGLVSQMTKASVKSELILMIFTDRCLELFDAETWTFVTEDRKRFRNWKPQRVFWGQISCKYQRNQFMSKNELENKTEVSRFRDVDQ